MIEIREKDIDRSLKYLSNDAEFAALMTVPKVLKRGIEISGHGNHKNRGYDTFTFAAPVEINGKRGNVAVVVRKTGKYNYYTHRILMPDGSEFVFEENKNTEVTTVDVTANKGSKGSTITSVSNDNVSQNDPSVNSSSMQEETKYSLKEDSAGDKLLSRKLKSARSIQTKNAPASPRLTVCISSSIRSTAPQTISAALYLITAVADLECD